MAQDTNTVVLVGRLTKDAELQYTNTGMAITKMSLAVGESIKKGDAWEDYTNFFDVTLWGKRGESLNQYLQKGTQISVTGTLKQERWEKDGQQRSRVSVKCETLQLLAKPSGNSGNNQNSKPQGKPQGNFNSGFQPSGGFDDDIPF